MAVSCTYDLPNPPDNIPVYRCQQVPLPEKPLSIDDPLVRNKAAPPLEDGALPTASSLESLLGCFDQAYDYIEYARVYSDRAAESDDIAKKSKSKQSATSGSTSDSFPAEDAGASSSSSMYKNMDSKASKRDFLFRKQKRPRVLLWCKNGMDRSCAIAAAYLIRKYGITLKRAQERISAKRLGSVIHSTFLKALEVWAEKHALGELLCEDCIAEGKQPETIFDNPQYEAIIQQTASYIATSHPEFVLNGNIKSILVCNPGQVHPSRISDITPARQRIKPLIIDLILGGVNLRDQGLGVLANALLSANAVACLNRIDLRNNHISGEGCAVLAAMVTSRKPGDAKIIKNNALISVDLSNNRYCIHCVIGSFYI